MKVTIAVIVGVCSAGLVMAGICKKPDPNTKKCYDPNNNVSSCSQVSMSECAAKAQYNVKDFPRMPVDAQYGLVHEVFRQCWQEKHCFIDEDSEMCKAPNQFGAWNDKAKIEDNGGACTSPP
jgi:hypothetical protein